MCKRRVRSLRTRITHGRRGRLAPLIKEHEIVEAVSHLWTLMCLYGRFVVIASHSRCRCNRIAMPPRLSRACHVLGDAMGLVFAKAIKCFFRFRSRRALLADGWIVRSATWASASRRPFNFSDVDETLSRFRARRASSQHAKLIGLAQVAEKFSRLRARRESLAA